MTITVELRFSRVFSRWFKERIYRVKLEILCKYDNKRNNLCGLNKLFKCYIRILISQEPNVIKSLGNTIPIRS